MRLLLTFLLYLACCNTSWCVPSKPAPDSASTLLIILQKDIASIKRTNDSLTRELFFFKVKEQTYSDLYGALASHYEGITGLIVGGIFAIAGLVSFGFFRSTLRKFEKAVASQKAEFDATFRVYSQSAKDSKEENARHFAALWNNISHTGSFDPFFRFQLFFLSMDNLIEAAEIRFHADDNDSLLGIIDGFIKELNSLDKGNTSREQIDQFR
ncbi:MAG: hypothetical protein J7576_18480, partial [Siphonobacter aquaeclarae]|nr:hypothetical protein [Siphonobacter aquaeclarae]